MWIEDVERDVRLFRGDAYEGVATAFARGDEVLLVDALASAADAAWMRREIEEAWGKSVRAIVVTHYMSDHVAGLRMFPGARVIAHEHFIHTYLSQPGRSAEDDAAFATPTTLVGGRLTLDWGRHTLALFHNPGKTLCTLSIDVPSADMVFASDNIVGNIVYVSSGAPALIDASIERLQRRRRTRVVPGHVGLFSVDALSNARRYLETLRRRVKDARRERGTDAAVAEIAIEDCVAPCVTPSGFEREWHVRNLERIVERRLFTVDAFEKQGAGEGPVVAGRERRGLA